MRDPDVNEALETAVRHARTAQEVVASVLSADHSPDEDAVDRVVARAEDVEQLAREASAIDSAGTERDR